MKGLHCRWAQTTGVQLPVECLGLIVIIAGGLNIGTSTMRKPQRIRKRPKRHELCVELILAWADAYFARTGRWPNINSGRIDETVDDTWRRIDDALRQGFRGLQHSLRLSLARVLEKYRGVRNSEFPPKLTVSRIVTWAKAHHRRTGRWPNDRSGAIVESSDETWLAIDMSLRKGRRGLPRGASLARLLEDRLGVRNLAHVSRLQIQQILTWADEFYQLRGRWPNRNSGAIADAPGENWCAINSALTNGHRGFPGGSSLAKLLARKRGARRAKSKFPQLTDAMILQWCDCYMRQHGEWPTKRSGPISDALGDTWRSIDDSLRCGYRGMPGGSSLAKLLDEHRHGKR